MRRVTLIAGSGALAPLMAEAARRAGDTLQIIDIVGRTDLAGTVQHIPLARAADLIATVKSFRTSHLVMAGGVHISDAEREGIADAFGLAGKVARVAGDVGIAGMILMFCRVNRIKLVGAHEVAPDLLAPQGYIAGPALDSVVAESARLAVRAARAIGAIDLGQSVVVSGNRPIAAEDAGGTDALLVRAGALRAAGLAGNSGLPMVLGKAKKPKQPRFVDLPAIGAQTVDNAAAAGVRAIALEAGNTLLIERPEIEARAVAHGISIVGVRHG
jgi:DUF1009 family protein